MKREHKADGQCFGMRITSRSPYQYRLRASCVKPERLEITRAGNATLALLSAPTNQQAIKINEPLFYYYPGSGSDMRIRGIDGQSLNPGETVDLRYVIYWNDGRKLDEVNALKQRVQSGELNARFRTQ